LINDLKQWIAAHFWEKSLMEFTLSNCIEGFGMTNGLNSCHSEGDLTQSETVVQYVRSRRGFNNCFAGYRVGAVARRCEGSIEIYCARRIDWHEHLTDL